MCIVPVFFDYLDKDVGVMNLVCMAANDLMIIHRIAKLKHRFDKDGVRKKQLIYFYVTLFFLLCILFTLSEG